MSDRFNGGGTPVQAILPQPQYQPQYQQPQYQQQQYQQQQQQYQQQPQYQMSKKEEYTSDKFKKFTGCSWQTFVLIIVLFIIFGNAWIYDLEKGLLPISLRMGNPPIIAVVFNAIIVGLFYLLISKFIS